MKVEKPIRFMVAAMAVCFAVNQVRAEYISPELQNIPLQRILANLTKKAEAEPTNADTLHHLARTHAMAFAQKWSDTDEIKSWKGWRGADPELPWFGYEPAFVPYNKVKEVEDEEMNVVAAAHLDTAIDYYKKALKAKSDDTTIKLGLAWCLMSRGDTEAAVPLFREVAAAAWEKESKSGGTFGPILFVETASYLAPLLDKEKDAKELADMEAKKQKLLALPRAITPLVVPLVEDLDANALIDRSASVRFDLDGSGRQDRWEWISKNSAWLVYDPNQTGKITSAIQMFGNRTFLLFCNDGYEALSLLDDNGDGKLQGNELNGLALWQDADSDGVSDAGEVKNVQSYGITSLSTKSDRHSSGILYSNQGATFKDGSARPTYDLILNQK